MGAGFEDHVHRRLGGATEAAEARFFEDRLEPPRSLRGLPRSVIVANDVLLVAENETIVRGPLA